MAFWSKFFGSSGSTAAGVAIGATAVPALAPAVETIVQEAWLNYPDKAIGALTLAEGVAQGQVNRAWAEEEAARTGFNADRFQRMIDIANIGPGVGRAFELWRRGTIKEPGFRRALRRLGLEQEWIDDLVQVKEVRLDPAVIAVAVQRGLIANMGILPVGPPSAVGKVPPMPEVGIDPFTEAEAAGVDAERIKVLTRIVGLPASPDLAARMVFRGIIEKADFDRAIAEGNTRNEWAPFLFEGFRDIPSTLNYVEGRLRGWIDTAAMHAGAARHGMSAEDADLLFKVHGRPLSWHQTWIGLQRGGTYDGPIDAIDPAFLHSLRQSNIRPEWYNLAWHSRYTYPSAFVMRALTQDGTLTQAQAEADLLDMGWRPDRAKQASQKWAAGTGTTSKGLTATDLANEYEALWITRAQYVAGLQQLGYSADNAAAKADAEDAKRARQARNALVARIHTQYVSHRLSRDATVAALSNASVPARVRDSLLPDWDVERDITADALTAAQIKKAFKAALFTRAEAIDRLEAKGYDAPDANIYLDQ